MRFKIGQIVELAADPKRRGPVIGILKSDSGNHRYRVFHTDDNSPEYYEDQLRPSASSTAATELEELEVALRNQNFISPEEFRARITAERISTPQTDTLYSLHAARIQYIPFQFKPLLRFLRADQPRLLIADEVGVGKTIEAGLILREMQSRQDVDSVLIVCPKALVQKWRDEMKRFDENFHILDGGNLRYCIKQCHSDGQWPRGFSKVIAPLELLRQKQYVDTPNGNKPVLESLDPAPRFSLMIVDEAHHLRNPETSSHKLARMLCDRSEAVIFLSATPVQLGSENLFQLLNLLRPDIFPDFTVFEQMTAPNASILQALRHIRHPNPEGSWQQESVAAIDAAMSTDWGSRALATDPRMRDWRNKLATNSCLDERARIQLLRDLEEMHTLARVMTRTRRRDIGRFTTREPHTVEVRFSQAQTQFYETLIDFRRQLLLEEHDARVVNLVSHTLERQASSCLPAMLPMLDQILATNRFASSAHTDDLAEESGREHRELPASLIDQAAKLRRSIIALPADDSKLAQLIEISKQVIESSGKKKILVFSYFLHTLDYLEDKLRASGLRVGMVSGKTEEDQRETLRDCFRKPYSEPDALDILLSSEVGCEGLDYEFCDCLVNYDIPWNPMRIEQRIGRIDRFGQTSEKVHIYNFITPDTIEERVFHRCFVRLGVFKDTVGDLEEVLGKLAKDLTQIAYDPSLSPQQAEERAQQIVDNELRRTEEQRRLAKESASLLGWQSAFAEEMDSLVEQGGIVSPTDLERMICLYVVEKCGGSLLSLRKRGRHQLRLNADARQTLLRELKNLRQDHAAINFVSWLESGKTPQHVTFEQETAAAERDLPFITPAHPLAKAAIAFWQGESQPLVARLSINDSSLAAGLYLAALELWETIAARPEFRLHAFIWDAKQRRRVSTPKSFFSRLTNAGELSSATQLNHAEIRNGLQSLDDDVDVARKNELDKLKRSNDELLDRQHDSQSSYYENRLARVDHELAQARNQKIIVMKQAEKSRIERERDEKLGDIEERRACDIVRKRIALCLLQALP